MLGQKQSHDIGHGKEQLGAGVQPVKQGVAWEVLARVMSFNATYTPPSPEADCFC